MLSNQTLDARALAAGILNLGNPYRFAQVFSKAEKGEPITIGFLGGSITQDSSATKHENCYAYRVFSWFGEQFAKSSLTYVNAGIGATTSQFAVARVEDDLLRYEPDIVICEFSVNDTNTSFYQEYYEGLIRKILQAKSKPALAVFHNVVYDTGESAQEVHFAVAKHYDLPAFSMRESIFEEIQKGTVVREEITADNLHPNDLGHRLVSEVLCNGLGEVLSLAKQGGMEEPELPAPMTPNRYEKSRRIQGTGALVASKGFTKDPAEQWGVRDVFKRGFTASETGSFLSFAVHAKKISVQYRKTISHPAPEAKVFVDGKEVATLVSNFEETWGDCLYLQDVWEGVEGEHTVSVVISKTYPNPGKAFYFVSLICG